MQLPCATHLSYQLSSQLAQAAQAHLLDTYIEQDHAALGTGGARTKAEGVSVWVLIGYLEAMDGAIEQTAIDYELPPDAVRAALIYFHHNPDVIAARIEENRLLRAG